MYIINCGNVIWRSNDETGSNENEPFPNQLGVVS